MKKNHPSKKKKRIGQRLVEAGIITAKQLKIALDEQRKLKGGRERLGEILLKSGFIDENTLTLFLEKYLGIPYAELKNTKDINPAAVNLIPERMARALKLIAIGFNEGNKKLIVAMANPFDVIAVDTIKLKTGCAVERRFSHTKEIESAIEKFYEEEVLRESVHDFLDIKEIEKKHEEARALTGAANLEEEAVKTPVIEFVDHILSNAVRSRASDIHIEPREDKLSIRYRIDGFLQDTFPPPKEMQSAIIARIKLLSEMNIAEQRLPQDGRFNFTAGEKTIDVRAASTPITQGEKLVLRLLDSASLLVSMDDLGMVPDNIEDFKRILKQPYGLVLVTGPTGSGKTTTLYSALNYINTPDKNIVTIEDPVEYQLDGINQIQTKFQIGLTFASGLRAVLRQDPDIIMIGEIRDLETLENAVKASLTGHLVLSTIHTNDAASVVMRLMHMGLEQYLISSCLSLVIAQRLVRKICQDCKEKIAMPKTTLIELEKKFKLSLSSVSFYKGKGCPKCSGIGYLGRTGLFEFLLVSKNVKRLILSEGITDAVIKKEAQAEGMKDFLQVGVEKIGAGITTLDEVLRVTVLEKSE